MLLGAGENPQWLYSVHFAGPELWGQETDPSISVYVDAWGAVSGTNLIGGPPPAGMRH